MEMKVLFGGAIMLGGWLWFYLFVRQFLFNFMTAYPLIKQMTAADAELAELLETLRNREDMKMLFKLAKDATPDDVRRAVKIIEALHND